MATQKSSIEPVRSQDIRAIRASREPIPHTAAAENGAMPTEAEIARIAYRIWEERGCPDGCAEEHWREAEQQLRKIR
jgi:hypothetical protein